jgi:hypothetical protein
MRGVLRAAVCLERRTGQGASAQNAADPWQSVIIRSLKIFQAQTTTFCFRARPNRTRNSGGCFAGSVFGHGVGLLLGLVCRGILRRKAASP